MIIAETIRNNKLGVFRLFKIFRLIIRKFTTRKTKRFIKIRIFFLLLFAYLKIMLAPSMKCPPETTKITKKVKEILVKIEQLSSKD